MNQIQITFSVMGLIIDFASLLIGVISILIATRKKKLNNRKNIGSYTDASKTTKDNVDETLSDKYEDLSAKSK